MKIQLSTGMTFTLSGLLEETFATAEGRICGAVFIPCGRSDSVLCWGSVCHYHHIVVWSAVGRCASPVLRRRGYGCHGRRSVGCSAGGRCCGSSGRGQRRHEAQDVGKVTSELQAGLDAPPVTALICGTVVVADSDCLSAEGSGARHVMVVVGIEASTPAGITASFLYSSGTLSLSWCL